MIRRTTPGFVLALSFLWAIPASAGPVSYTFTATVSVSKTTEGVSNTGGDPPASPFEDAYWFPTLHHGQTYQATGWLQYDPDLLVGDEWSDAPPIAFININDYTFSIASNLGFSTSGDSLSFVDSHPAVVSGFMPNSPYYGEDAALTLLRNAGASSAGSDVPPTLDGFTHGTLLSFGSGFYVPEDGGMIQTRLMWRGSIDAIQRVPEPATLVLLGLGSAFLVRRRRAARVEPRG